MKNIIKFFGLLSLICFSFFYTDKVIQVTLEQDSIMISINEVKDKYHIEPTNATVNNDEIIPGINGKTVNINNSYNNMKNIGIFSEKYLVYDEIKPSISIYDNYNKYITCGNIEKHIVSLLFILNNDKLFDNVNNILIKNDIKANYFVDYNFLNNNTTLVKNIKNAMIYSYGNKGEYTQDILLYSNNLISRITKNNANFCLSTEKNDNILKLCSNNKFFTIVPTFYIKDGIYNNIKGKIKSGDLILLDINNANIDELDILINYIKGKGLEFGYLNELINEKYS